MQKNCGQGRNEKGKGVQLPGRRITAGGAENSQQCREHFLQCNTFASERAYVRTVGRQTYFLPRAPSNLVTPLTADSWTALATALKLVFRFHFGGF